MTPREELAVLASPATLSMVIHCVVAPTSAISFTIMNPFYAHRPYQSELPTLERLMRSSAY